MGESVDGMGEFVSRLFVVLGARGQHCSADYMQGTRLTFKSEEDAVQFALKQGLFLLYLCYMFSTDCASKDGISLCQSSFLAVQFAQS
jgi:hypothetical protein